jgi:hypothetical protein
MAGSVTNRNKNVSKHFSSKLPFQTLTTKLFTRNNAKRQKEKVSGKHSTPILCSVIGLEKYHFRRVKTKWRRLARSQSVVFVTSVTESDYNRLVVQPFCFWKCAGRQACRQKVFTQTSCFAITSLLCYFFCSDVVWDVKDSADLPQQLSKSFSRVPFIFLHLCLYLFFPHVTLFCWCWCFSRIGWCFLFFFQFTDFR